MNSKTHIHKIVQYITKRSLMATTQVNSLKTHPVQFHTGRLLAIHRLTARQKNLELLHEQFSKSPYLLTSTVILCAVCLASSYI